MTTVLDKTTLVPLGLAAALAMGMIGGHLWLTDQLQAISASSNSELRAINTELTRLANKLELASYQSWSIIDQQRWIEAFRKANPTLQIPAAIHTTWP